MIDSFLPEEILQPLGADADATHGVQYHAFLEQFSLHLQGSNSASNLMSLAANDDDLAQ